MKFKTTPGWRIFAFFVVVISLSLVAWYITKQSNSLNNWSRTFKGLGTSSSPRAADLNGDGILDIVLGTGQEEFQATDVAVLALNGANGEILWKVGGINQVVGSAAFKDITGDGVPDVFIGGRTAQFYAINGKTGKIIWQYLKPGSVPDSSSPDTTLLNFYNPQFVPDQNRDGEDDILTTFGGYVHAQKGDLDRPAGMIILLDAEEGKILKKTPSPDGKEIYMSPVIYDFGNGPTIIFGTGGETISGNLFALRFEDFMASGTKKCIKIDTGHNKGFIAPPLIADITGDKIADIVITTMDGYTNAYNGKDFSVIWSKRAHPRGEVQSMPAPLYFNDDDVPDFFNSFNLGEWPENPTTIHVILSGIDGRELFRDTLGLLQFSSPVLLDHNQDSFPDVIYPINTKIWDVFPVYQTQLMLYNGRTGAKTPIDSLYRGKTLGSTPLITDLDSDGKADLIYTYMTQSDKFITYRDLVVKRIEFDIKLTENLWGGYMGPNSTSVFKTK